MQYKNNNIKLHLTPCKPPNSSENIQPGETKLISIYTFTKLSKLALNFKTKCSFQSKQRVRGERGNDTVLFDSKL